MEASVTRQKGYKGLAMEGFVARRYAKLRRSGSQLGEWRKQAARLTSSLRDGADILELAPGPGYFAIELARTGRFHVTGLDISRTFVQIADDNAREAGVGVTFRLGDASQMPFPDATFDMVVCQAAFKNFSRPREALDEMYRVLREGGTAVIQDMRKDASDAAIREEVSAMGLGRTGAFMTRRILGGLRRRAYTRIQFEQLAAQSRFGGGETTLGGIDIDVRLRKRAAGA